MRRVAEKDRRSEFSEWRQRAQVLRLETGNGLQGSVSGCSTQITPPCEVGENTCHLQMIDLHSVL